MKDRERIVQFEPQDSGTRRSDSWAVATSCFLGLGKVPYTPPPNHYIYNFECCKNHAHCLCARYAAELNPQEKVGIFECFVLFKPLELMHWQS